MSQASKTHPEDGDSAVLSQAKLVLRGVISLQVVGLLLYLGWQQQTSALSSLLYFDFDLAESVSTAVHWGLVIGLTAVLLSTLIRPHVWLLVSMGVWLLAEAVIKWYRRDGFLSWVEPIEYASRYMAPICLAYLMTRGSVHRSAEGTDLHAKAIRTRSQCERYLRIAAALTFLGHGYVAMQGNPHFVDLIMGFSLHVFGTKPVDHFAQQAVFLIGVIDVGIAFLLLETRHRWLLIYMTFWGLITAFSRLFYFGWDGLPDALTRIPNGGVPLVCLLLLQKKTTDAAVEQGENER